MESGGKLDSDMITAATGFVLESEIEELKLAKQELIGIEDGVFQNYVNMKDLDMSGNFLQYFPEDCGMKTLQKLNIAENQFTDIEFIKQFTLLEELSIAGNVHLEESDKYIATLLCPNLKTIDGADVGPMREHLLKCEEHLRPMIEEVFYTHWKDKYLPGQLAQEFEGLKIRFAKDLKDRPSMYINPALRKLDSFMMDIYAAQLLNKIRLSDRSLTLCRKPSRESRQQRGRGRGARQARPPRKQPEPLDYATTMKRAYEESEEGAEGPQPVVVMSPLDELADYDPVFFLRCHTAQAPVPIGAPTPAGPVPTSAKVKVWKCAFEPDPDVPGETSRLLATCGGTSVCLIDCVSGKVLRKYVPQPKEPVNQVLAPDTFYCLAWTTVEVADGEGPQPDRTRRVNFLGVGGAQGKVYMLSPEKLLCFANVKVGEAPVSCISFHPDCPTLFFCGCEDGSLSLFDMGVPRLPDYQSNVKHVWSLRIDTNVLNISYMSLHESLIVTTDRTCRKVPCPVECLAYNCPPKTTTIFPPPEHFESKGRKRRGTSDHCVDGLALLSDHAIAVKFVSLRCQTIVVYHVATMSMMSRLNWMDDIEFFIQIGSHPGSGLLVSGDNEGRMWLYNVDRFLAPDTDQDDVLYAVSRILPWPKCSMNDKEVKETHQKPVINTVCVSSDREYVVAGTDNNLVCIWKVC